MSGTKVYEDTVTADQPKDVSALFADAKTQSGGVEIKAETAAGSLTIAFDANAVGAIGGNDVTLKANLVENSAQVSDAELVIEVTLAGATFSEGKAKVTVPFAKSVPEDKVLKVYFINGDQRQDMNASLVDGNVVFETDHFSTYAVVFEDAPSDSGGKFPIAIVIVGAVAAVAVIGAAAVFFLRKS